MKLYRKRGGSVVEHGDRYFDISGTSFDELVWRDDVLDYLKERIATGWIKELPELGEINAPVNSQEVWAAGVTYLRSREARVEESKDAGGGSFYDRVYSADRPELFFKSPGYRVIGPGGNVRLRRDSNWTVPEPELTLLLSSTGKITGYTIGNDMSCRDIEGENPLYLPQAKTYDGSCAIGPCVLLTDAPLPRDIPISIVIRRSGKEIFTGQTDISRIKRPLQSLADFLFRHLSFPHGCFLMTGTGIVPPDDFALRTGDEIAITIPPIGTLTNHVA